MDAGLQLWMEEIRRFNPRLHLMGKGMLSNLEQDVKELLPLLAEIHEPEMADLGTGSGFPAIPFKILHPGARTVLIERSGKKCTFLRHMSERLEMEGLEIVEADPLVQSIGRFDAVMSRAFSPVSLLEKALFRILRDNGRFYYLYTGNSEPDLGPRFRRARTLSGSTLRLGIYILEAPLLTAA